MSAYADAMAPLGAPAARPWRHLARDRAGLAGLAVVTFFALVALASWAGLAGGDWAAISDQRFAPPSAEHWLGTNRLGQDLFARAVHGTGVAFEVGLLVAVASTLIGGGLGAVAGWRPGGWADEAVLWLTGVLDSIPFYLLVAAVAFALGGHPASMHLAMVATLWTTTARLVRGEVIRIRRLEFVEAARALGLAGPVIVLRHVVPNTYPVLLVQGTLVFVAAIKAEVILSFLGIGIRDGVSWGLMLAESTDEVLSGQFGNFLVASACLFALLMAFNLLSDALQDATDPRYRGR